MKRAGIPMGYVAMFDEVDEGTALFKCSNDVPTGRNSQFVTFEGLPSDFYLRLVGKGGKLVAVKFRSRQKQVMVNLLKLRRQWRRLQS